MESRKIVPRTYLQEKNRDADTVDLWIRGKERVGQMERISQTYIHYMCKMIPSEKLLHRTGHSTWCSVMT